LIGNREVDAVLVSIGVNEFRFGEVAEFCAIWAACQNRKGFNGSPQTLSDRIATRLGALPTQYDNLAKALAKAPAVQPERVYLVEYPDFLHRNATAFCDEILDDAVPVPGADISEDEAGWLFRNLLVPLNTAIAATPTNHHWKVIGGIAAAFTGHGYCADGNARWIVTASESKQNQGNKNGALHPNATGHDTIARLAHTIISNDLYPGGVTRKP
jgi:hypothetical protein